MAISKVGLLIVNQQTYMFMTVFSSDHQEHNLDWFPRMRAMSLVSSDADGEQNEIRSLQEKLECTMKLVSNLSGQLTELKEQVMQTFSLQTCPCGVYRKLIIVGML